MICRPPQREAIEMGFLRWRSPAEMVSDYQLAHHSPIYLHAHATGLLGRRTEASCTILDRLLEQAEKVTSWAAILGATRLYA